MKAVSNEKLVSDDDYPNTEKKYTESKKASRFKT